MFGKLAGKKTYVVAALAVLGALAAYLTGDLAATDAGKVALDAILAACIRNGIK
jgi:hypothetical protein